MLCYAFPILPLIEDRPFYGFYFGAPRQWNKLFNAPQRLNLMRNVKL
jgi:hypothetical protein